MFHFSTEPIIYEIWLLKERAVLGDLLFYICLHAINQLDISMHMRQPHTYKLCFSTSYHSLMYVSTYFRDTRSSVLEESLRKLGVERLGKEDVQKMQWEVLEAKIGNWIHYMRIAVRSLWKLLKYLYVC